MNQKSIIDIIDDLEQYLESEKLSGKTHVHLDPSILKLLRENEELTQKNVVDKRDQSAFNLKDFPFVYNGSLNRPDILLLGLTSKDKINKENSIFKGDDGNLLQNLIKAMGDSSSILLFLIQAPEADENNHIQLHNYILNLLSHFSPTATVIMGDELLNVVSRKSFSVDCMEEWFEINNVKAISIYDSKYMNSNKKSKKVSWERLQKVLDLVKK